MEVDAATAGPGDVADIGALAEAAAEELTPHRGGEMWRRREARPGPHAEAIASMLDDPARHAVIAGRIDGVVVGYAIASVEPLHDGETVADLTDLYVLPEGRGVGVGEAMMIAVTEWAGSVGCIGIDSIALPGDRETKNFFESFGLVARALRVHRSIS
ncbi:MAG: GNAT family N-acetyltransferase [Acidimicrobiales bacterium]|nr:GNAT family N-acetyltransferase [Acidimicrobiales bacterium]